jgi:hypothetical protein
MSKEVNKFLKDQLNKFPEYALTEKEQRQIDKGGIDTYITSKVFSNKFRKSSPDDDTRNEIISNIKESVKKNKPIHFTIPTGGYKKWQFQSAPFVDWSEFFHLRFMFEYFAPILKVYKPGIILDYFSNAWLIKVISHYTQSDLDKYATSFKKLIDLFKPSFPSNLQVRYKVVAEQVPEETLVKRILKNRSMVECEWKELAKEEQQIRLKSSERNMRWDLLEKDKKLSNVEKEKVIYEGKIIHDSLLKGGWNNDLDYLFNNNRIPIIHRKTKVKFLHIATCSGAFVQFWVGTGLLEKRGDRIIPRILSYEQYQKVKDKLQQIPINLFDIESFKQIEILSN